MRVLIDNREHLKRALETCSDVFEKTDRFAIPDRIIASAITKFQENDTIDAVLPKTILINSFYATQIYDTERAASHILTTDTDARLASGDLTLVDSIRHGHGIITKKSGRERDFYSFATKYAALHEPSKFPIFDSLVMKLLTQLNKQLKFCPNFTQGKLRDYQFYVSAIDELIGFTDLKSFRYKQLDQGLWIYAKHIYTPASFSRAEGLLMQRTLSDNGD